MAYFYVECSTMSTCDGLGACWLCVVEILFFFNLHMKRKQKPQPQKDILEEFTVQGSNISTKNGHFEDDCPNFPFGGIC